MARPSPARPGRAPRPNIVRGNRREACRREAPSLFPYVPRSSICRESKIFLLRKPHRCNGTTPVRDIGTGELRATSGLESACRLRALAAVTVGGGGAWPGFEPTRRAASSRRGRRAGGPPPAVTPTQPSLGRQATRRQKSTRRSNAETEDQAAQHHGARGQ